MKGKQFSREQLDRIFEMTKAGVAPRRIAAVMGVSFSAVYRNLREARARGELGGPASRKRFRPTKLIDAWPIGSMMLFETTKQGYGPRYYRLIERHREEDGPRALAVFSETDAFGDPIPNPHIKHLRLSSLRVESGSGQYKHYVPAEKLVVEDAAVKENAEGLLGRALSLFERVADSVDQIEARLDALESKLDTKTGAIWLATERVDSNTRAILLKLNPPTPEENAQHFVKDF